MGGPGAPPAGFAGFELKPKRRRMATEKTRTFAAQPVVQDLDEFFMTFFLKPLTISCDLSLT